MISIKKFLSDWLRTVRNIVITPRKFFSWIYGDTDMNRPFGFALTTIFFESLLSVISVLVILSPKQTLSWLASPSFDNTFLFSILILFLIYLYSFFSSLISLPVYALISHVLLKICGAHGSLKDTFRVSCYYLAMTIVVTPVSFVLIPIISMAYSGGHNTSEFFIYIIIIPAVLIILGFVAYSFYILFVGFSVVHGISMKRVFAAVIGIPSVIMLLFIALIIGLVFIAGHSSSTTYYNNSYPVRYESEYPSSPPSIISAPYGTAPQVDGYYTSDDIWDEADPKYFSLSGVNYTIAAKHDGIMLYILIRRNGGQEWDDPLSLNFEQDGITHDHDLKTGRNDEKYNGVAQYGPDNFNDAHFEGGVAESRDGTVRGNYRDGYWTQEWVIPLRSEDPADIYVDEFPATLGFAVLPFSGFGGSVFPSGNTERFDPGTWGDIKILDSDHIKLKPQPSKIVAAAGKPPVIDGSFTPEDGWEGLMDMVSKSAVYYSLAAKHDSENLYVLVKWKGEPYYNSVFLLFEQDGTSHDHDLGTGRNDMKLNNIANDYFDYDAYGKMDTNNGQNGRGITNYSNGSWVYEWAIPLCSGDERDICIEKFPSTTGFMVEVGNENIFFPHNASRERSGSWGDLEIR